MPVLLQALITPPFSLKYTTRSRNRWKNILLQGNEAPNIWEKSAQYESERRLVGAEQLLTQVLEDQLSRVDPTIKSRLVIERKG